MLANCKGSDSKYVRFCAPTISVATIQLCHCSPKLAIDNSGHGGVLLLFTETGTEPGLVPDPGVCVAEDRDSAIAKPEI